MDTKLVIFDLDGTLLDTIDDLAAATNHALQQNGYPAHERSAYRYFVGNGITRLVERALPEAARDEETVMRVRRDFVDYYSEHNTDRTRPYPGIESLVGKIAERGVRMAVASNKYQAATVISRRVRFASCLANGKESSRNPIRPSCSTFFAKRAAKKRKPFMWAIPKSIC